MTKHNGKLANFRTTYKMLSMRHHVTSLWGIKWREMNKHTREFRHHISPTLIHKHLLKTVELQDTLEIGN